MGDHLQVNRVAASTVVAQMVDLLFAGDIAVIVGEHHQMNSYRLTVEGHAAIATTFTVTRVGAGPDVTWARLIVEHVAEVFDFDSLVDAGHDLPTTVGQLCRVYVEG